ncbi:MAG: hypothetical protein H7329_02930 [Opitutaceae bacterium]|nr:hypothetical protein [Cytophagales bacterium]
MNNWTAAEFLTYIYQLVADSDFETEDSEISIVKVQVADVLKKHFNIENYSYQTSLKIIQATEGVTLLNCTEIIKELMPTFEFSKEAKRDILDDLNSIASSDDTVTKSEQETINFIRQVFMTVDMPLSW